MGIFRLWGWIQTIQQKKGRNACLCYYKDPFINQAVPWDSNQYHGIQIELCVFVFAFLTWKNTYHFSDDTRLR